RHPYERTRILIFLMSLLQLRRYEFTFVRDNSLFLRAPHIRELLEKLFYPFLRNQVFGSAMIFSLLTPHSVSIPQIRPLPLATFRKWSAALLPSVLRSQCYSMNSLSKMLSRYPLLIAPKW